MCVWILRRSVVCPFEYNVWSAGVSVTNAWIYNTACHFFGLFLCLFMCFQGRLWAVGAVCVCFCEYESLCMSNACMQSPPALKRAALMQENVSTIFSRAGVLISEAKQTGPRLWAHTKTTLWELSCRKCSSERRVQGNGNEMLKRSREWSRMRTGDGSSECPH